MGDYRGGAAVVGAGRLGSRLAQRLHEACGKPTALWSRRFASDGPPIGEEVYRVVGWAELFAAEVIFFTIPGAALVTLPDVERRLRSYEGVVASASLDVRIEDLRRLAPKAHIVRFAPFLLPGRHEIPSIITQASADDARWRQVGRSAIEALGPFDGIESEEAYEALLIFGAPYPAVVYQGIRSVFQEVGDECQWSAEHRRLGERMFWRAMSAMASQACTGALDCVDTVATPGGVTAKGLDNLKGFTSSAWGLANIMLRHGQILGERLKDRPLPQPPRRSPKGDW